MLSVSLLSRNCTGCIFSKFPEGKSKSSCAVLVDLNYLPGVRIIC